MANLKPLTDSDTMPFGKHKGIKLANVPDDYLAYALSKFDLTPYEGLKEYIEDNLDSIKPLDEYSHWG